MGICVTIFTNGIDMEMKQLPVLSSVYHGMSDSRYTAKRESGENPEQSCCCMRAARFCYPLHVM